MGSMDFQQATANRIMDLFTKSEPVHLRVLLADEVGLGKTIVAREVVSRMRDWRKSLKDDIYKVVYICSNVNIARQNISKLGISDQLSVADSRLSMQHLYIATKEKELKRAAEEKQKMPEQIIPLTPNTSFDFRSSCGIANERALIYEIFRRRPEFDGYTDELSNFFRVGVNKDNWNDRYRHRYTGVVDSLGEEYLSSLKDKIDKKDNGTISELAIIFHENRRYNYDDQARIISRLRQMYAEISVEMLEPDLVIMDEFQRFKDLLVDNDDEQSLLTRTFFNREDTRILLLSATPYKPYSTLEELNESKSDEHFSDFKEVVGFLNGGDNGKETFNETWDKFNFVLSQISTADYEIVLATKNEAEASLYNLMCRTERFNSGIIESKEEKLSVTQDDIRAYFQARKLLESVNLRAGKGGNESFPIEYVKSAPYLMSFMDRYKLKEYISGNLTPKILQMNLDRLYLPYDKVNGYKNIPASNAKLEYLRKMLFEQQQAYKLLWVPASHPYYKTKGVYSKNAGFSKVLVFSSWEMVPRMVSIMLSYYSEQKVLRELISRGKRPGPYCKDKRYGANRLKDEDNPLMCPCQYLANCYKPEKYMGQEIADVKAIVRQSVDSWLDIWKAETGIGIQNKNNSVYICRLMELMDGKDVELPEYVPANAADILTNAAIASPAICLYRLFGNSEKARQTSNLLISVFNRAESATALDLCLDKRTDTYVEKVLEYCVEGNLQAVLDEYDHMLDGNWDDVIKYGLLNGGNLQVDTIRSDHTIKKLSMRTNFAIPFTNAKVDDKTVAHTSNIRSAFNSPFRPFVLTTTSIGQEGLDFHWYARKLLHWNLPSNPVDMEQREGRVNRYKCLAIRQSLGLMYPNIYKWDDVFKAAGDDFKKENSDLVPYWCLPAEFPDECRCKVERIILQYPLSVDGARYDRLKKVLSLYRLTMGQPRQEELLDMLAKSQLSDKQIEELMINLCPFDKREK